MKRARRIAILLTVVLLLTTALPVATVGASPGPGIVGLWHLDEGSAATTVADSSGNANTGTIYGATPGVAGKFGNALSFGSSSDYVTIPDSASLDFGTADFTIEAWIKLNTIPSGTDFRGIFDKGIGLSSGEGRYSLFVKPGGGLRLHIYGQSGTEQAWYDSSITIPDTSWHYVAVSADRDGYATFAIDASTQTVDISGSSSYNVSSTHAAAIGVREHDKGDHWFDGTIDEVRIWDTVYADFEVAATPPVAFNPVSTLLHEIVATVDPVAPGVTVGLKVIDGPNIGLTDSGQTDANGQVTLSYTGGSDDGIDTIRIWVDNNWNGDYDADVDYPVTVEKYWLENFVTGGGKLNMNTLGLEGNKVAGTFAGTVGVLEGEGIVGQFQIVDHTGKKAEAWHCNNDFTYLNFGGPPTGSPPASHSIAVFTGTFTSNRDSEDWEVTIIIQDLGEPGAGVDKIKFGGLAPYPIDGGNFQVHNIIEP